MQHYFLRRLIRREPFRSLLIRRFSQLYYYDGQVGRTWSDTFYMGVRLLKSPTDLWVYQEILHQTRPDLVIETGTAWSGSALHLAHLCELLGRGRVVSVDIDPKPDLPRHERVTYLTGSSTAPEIVGQMTREAEGKRVMVILDSDHSARHVLEELRLYAPLVSPGCYLIVEDTNVNNRPVLPEHGPGPWEAVAEFLKTSRSFEIDRSREKFLLTFNPSGYLRRITAPPTDSAQVRGD
jgi:cephalosporin hydroxylase